MTELEELTMIDRQLSINDIIADGKSSTTKWFFPSLFNLLWDCIENEIYIWKYIENQKAQQKKTKWRFTDEDGNNFEIEWIDCNRLSNLWQTFDHKYEGSNKMWFYLNSLSEYMRNRAGYKSFNVTLL